MHFEENSGKLNNFTRNFDMATATFANRKFIVYTMVYTSLAIGSLSRACYAWFIGVRRGTCGGRGVVVGKGLRGREPSRIRQKVPEI